MKLDTIKAFVAKRPVLMYFALVFAISWGGSILLLGPGAFPLSWTRFERLGPALYAVILAGPFLASVLLTLFLDGRAGLRAMLVPLRRWRVGAGWYLLALLPALLLGASQLALSAVFPEFVPAFFRAGAKVPILLASLGAALLFGFFEEVGWMGFAVPRLRSRHTVVATGVVVGLVWGAWHFLLFWESDTFSAALPLIILLVRLFSWLPGLRVLMVSMYDRTGSVLVVMLMHASVVFAQLILSPGQLPRTAAFLAALLIPPATMWLLAAVALATADGGRFASIVASPEETRRRMPGDDLIPDARYTVTHAVTIDSSPDRIWPWLAQLGSWRAGWYSYDLIDNGGRPSAERVLPQYQQVRPGDVFPALPGIADAFVVAAVDPPRDLVLIVPGEGRPVVSWEHLVEPLDQGRSRLIVRGRVGSGWKQKARDAGTPGKPPAFIEYVYRLLGRLPDGVMMAAAALGHRWMEARHIRGIRRRAEALG
jgi:membrane protease YdiL (CAAX protease family)